MKRRVMWWFAGALLVLAGAAPLVPRGPAHALGRGGGSEWDEGPAIPALIQALRDHRNRTNAGMFLFTIQEGAAIALGRASDGSGEAVPTLMATLKGTDYLPLRLAVIRALGDIGAAARPALPLL